LSQVPICLIGYMSVNTPGWPPTYEEALDTELEALGTVLLRLGVTREAYGQLVELTRDMLVDPEFTRLRDAIARALTVVPRLEHEDIEALCRATNTPIPVGKQEEPWNT
jgi:tripartite-type tricarboxylate transporter receptor subunit TctC